MNTRGHDPTSVLSKELKQVSIPEGVKLLTAAPPGAAAKALAGMHPARAVDFMEALPEAVRTGIEALLPEQVTLQWTFNRSWPEDSIGRLMEPTVAVFRTDKTVAEVIDKLRPVVGETLVTYCYVTDGQDVLLGVVTMRDLLFAEPGETLGNIMLTGIFSLHPATPLSDAMKVVVNHHFPVYPVCDDQGHLVGLVRGHILFEEQHFEISAQAGSMVGVDSEERHATPWPKSLKFRHPWLQLNLVTAFAAAAVVGIFQDTIDRIVILAMFLPVLAGQSGNTGCQALAVTLRGLTLGDLRAGSERGLVIKEAWLGLLNGALVGLVAAGGMYAIATWQQSPHALPLAFIVLMAMIGSCVISGVAGALIPLGLKRAGADPATASSIFLTTATDVVSMGMLLWLATMMLR